MAQLNTLRTNAINALQLVHVTKTTLDNATNNREVAFSKLKKLSTRIVSALAATDAKTQTVDDARSIHKKIQGQRSQSIKQLAEADGIGSPAKTHSVSQQSYDGLIEGFTKLIQTISIEPLYTPNEAELKVTSLNTMLVNMKATNTSVINATTAYSNARIARDVVLYAQNTGLKDTVDDVKSYVKSVYGTNSQQYKQLTHLKFTHQKNK